MSSKPLPMEVLAERHELPELERMLAAFDVQHRRIRKLFVVLAAAYITFLATLPGEGDPLRNDLWYTLVVFIALFLPCGPLIAFFRWVRQTNDVADACNFKRKLVELRAGEQK